MRPGGCRSQWRCGDFGESLRCTSYERELCSEQGGLFGLPTLTAIHTWTPKAGKLVVQNINKPSQQGHCSTHKAVIVTYFGGPGSSCAAQGQRSWLSHSVCGLRTVALTGATKITNIMAPDPEYTYSDSIIYLKYTST